MPGTAMRNILPLARRNLLKGAGFGIGAGLLTRVSGAAQAHADDIWSAEYWANKGNVKLNLWRKRIGAPKPGEPPLPVIFLAHGSSNSSRSSYDLNVPGRGEYSLMNVLAHYGYDVWTMDHDGYGRSGDSGGSSDIASSVEDIKAAVPVVAQETGQQKLNFYGTSSGAIRAGAYAMAQPERVNRLALCSFTYKGGGAEEIARRKARIDELRASPRRKRDETMIRSIFTRDGKPQTYDTAMADALVAAEMPFGDTIPAGTYVDMAANLPLVDPTKVLAPVLMVRGEFDQNSTNEDLLDFYRQLPNGDRQFVILPNTAHSVGNSHNRHLLWYALKNFFAAPAATA